VSGDQKEDDAGADADQIQQGDLSPYREGGYDVSLRVTDEFGRTDSHTLTNAFTAAAGIDEGPAIWRVEPGLVQLDDTVLINYTAVGRNVEGVHILLTGPDGEVALDHTVPEGDDLQHTIDPEAIEGLEEGPYDVTLEMRDAFGGREATTSEEAFVLVGDGSPDPAHGIGGQFDILHVSGSTSFLINTRLVGTDRPSKDVYIASDGAVTSYAHDLGADALPSGPFEDLRFETRGYEEIATNLTEFRGKVHITGQRRPLQPGTFALALGGGDSVIVRGDGVPDPRFPLDRATIELTEPAVDNLTTYRLPTANADERSFSLEGERQELSADDVGSLVDAGIEADRLAVGDRLLIEIEASGLWGAMAGSLGGPETLLDETETRRLTPAEFRSFLDRPEGVDLTLWHTNPERNEAQTEIDLLNATRDDVSIFLDPPLAENGSANPRGRIYVLVDTRPPAPFETQPENNETFRLDFSYEGISGEQYTYPRTERGEQPAPFDPIREPAGEQFPYFTENDTTVVRSTAVTFEERFVAYNRTTSKAGRW